MSYESKNKEILKKLPEGKKLHFTCDECGCVFKVSKKFTEYKQTGMNEYHYVYNCPECGKECYYYGN